MTNTRNEATTAISLQLSSLKKATDHPRSIALARKRLLEKEENDNDGLPALLCRLLQEVVDEFLRECRQAEAGSLSTNTATLQLQDCIQIHLNCSMMDPTLAEELGAQGTHVQLQRIIQFDTYTVEDRLTEEDVDTIIALQDMACQISMYGHFPMKKSPFWREVLIDRLPLTFEIRPVKKVLVEKQELREKNVAQNEVVLIHQVVSRQSAQEDVGFVMWPSAVVLSRWLITNSSILASDSSLRVLEIGAGCGLVGLLVARLVRSKKTVHSISIGKPVVLLSDFNKTVLENLDRNITLNEVEECCRTVGLDFYQQSGTSKNGWMDMNGSRQDPVDLVLAADMICQPSDAVYAANTIHDTLRSGGRAYVVCADAAHRFGVDHFERECNRVGLTVATHNVSDLYHGKLLQDSDLEKTTGYVEGMSLTLFVIEKPIVAR